MDAGSEIVRAVVAFSNALSGGRVYLGVNDDGNPQRRSVLNRTQKAEIHGEKKPKKPEAKRTPLDIPRAGRASRERLPV